MVSEEERGYFGLKAIERVDILGGSLDQFGGGFDVLGHTARVCLRDHTNVAQEVLELFGLRYYLTRTFQGGQRSNDILLAAFTERVTQFKVFLGKRRNPRGYLSLDGLYNSGFTQELDIQTTNKVWWGVA